MEDKITHTECIEKITSALIKVQSVMKPAVFNKVNPHFKSRYADFGACLDVSRQLLCDNGIAVIQSCQMINDKPALVTMLAHTSGQWMKSEFPIVATKMDSQGIGSAMTYAKRYSLCGMLGIVADEDADDDGEAAVGRTKKKEPVSTIMSEQYEAKRFYGLFNKEDQHLAQEYLLVVMDHFKWTATQAIEELTKDETKMHEKFNAWKAKKETK